MCGIYGIYSFDPNLPVDRARVEAMGDVLGHRGPDDSGLVASTGACFGHRRLAIIDLGSSHQPMWSADESRLLSFNGEILNYRDLRARSRYPFRTSGDTEVILARWAESGSECISELEGQFAFALLDRASRQLFLARDRLGILPLYYLVRDDEIIFASEIKAILAALDQSVPLDVESVGSYLRARSVAAPWTLYEGIKKVLPGHVLTAQGRRLRERAYWAPSSAGPMEDDSALTPRLDRLLRSAVERNLIADVPVGAYLSGGLDSSLITAIAADLKRTPIHTFAAGFADSRANELPNARSIATRLKTTHHEVLVTPEDFMAEWGRLSWHRDAPVSEASDVAVYRLAQAAREHVGVVMSGEGSDELFAGYPKHLLARPTRWVGSIPYPPRIRATRWLRRHTSSRKLAVALSAIGERTYRDRIGGWFAPFTTEEAIHLLGQRPARVDVLSRTDLVTSPLATMLRYDLASWLPDNLLERGDRMSMAASLELRPPFLDAGVVSFALALPDQRKIRGRTGKWILRQVAKAYLPAEIISQKKVGFTVPLAQWFRGGLRDFAFDRLRSGTSLATQLFDKREVNRLLGGHHSGGFDYSGQLWTLVSLEMWYERFASSISVGRQ